MITDYEKAISTLEKKLGEDGVDALLYLIESGNVTKVEIAYERPE